MLSFYRIIDKHRQRVQKIETIIDNNDNDIPTTPDSSCISLPPIKTKKVDTRKISLVFLFLNLIYFSISRVLTLLPLRRNLLVN